MERHPLRRGSPGCRDETAARQVLADLERKAEQVRSGVMTAAEAAIGDHQAAPLTEHFAAFDEHHQAKGVTKIPRADTGRYLRRLAADCTFRTLADLRREGLERWLALVAPIADNRGTTLPRAGNLPCGDVSDTMAVSGSGVNEITPGMSGIVTRVLTVLLLTIGIPVDAAFVKGTVILNEVGGRPIANVQVID